MKNDNLRSHFRLSYPHSVCPKLIMDQELYDIENVSECGVKVIASDDLGFMVHDSFLATIHFADGKEFSLVGQVVRTEGKYVCLHLDAPLPKSVLRNEVLLVMHNYPYH